MTYKHELEFQCETIEGLLAQHRVPGHVAGGTVTPARVCFKVQGCYGHLPGNLAEELARALGVNVCHVVREGTTLLIEVPNHDWAPEPVRLTSLVQQLRNVPPVTAVLGIADDGAPLLVRLPSPQAGHVLVTGPPGSGKAAFLWTMLISLALRHAHPTELALVAVNLGSTPFPSHLYPRLARPLVTDVGDAAEVLRSLERLWEHREARGESEPPVVAAFDELAGVVRSRQVRARLKQLVESGHREGIHVLAATQESDLAEVFPVHVMAGAGMFHAIAEGKRHRFTAAAPPGEFWGRLAAPAPAAEAPNAYTGCS